MKMSKSIALILIITMITVMFAGCSKEVVEEKESIEAVEEKEAIENQSSDKKESKEVIDLNLWTLANKQEALDSIVEVYNEANPNVHVTVSYFDTDGIKDGLKVAASSGTLPEMWFNWGGALGGFYADNDLTYDLTDYAKENGWYEKYNPGVLSLCTLNDQLAGYPLHYNVIGVFYRKDIFEEYGIEVPETFEQFEEACATLKANGITPITTAGLNGWHVMRFVELLVEHYVGAETHDALNTFKESWDNPKVIEAFTKYQEFVEKGYFPDGFVTFDPNDTQLLLYSGQAAMDIQGGWYDSMIVREGQNMDNYGVFPFPSGGTNRMSAFAEMVQMNANNTEEEIDEAVKFMDFYYGDENVSKYPEYYTLPLPIIGFEMPEGLPNVAKMMEDSAETGTFTITDQAFTPEVASALFDVQDGIAVGELTPEEGVKIIQEAIDKAK